MAFGDSVTFQPTTATPPSGTKVAVDAVSGIDYQAIKLDAGGTGVSVPLVAGSQLAAASLPVVLSLDGTDLLSRIATQAQIQTDELRAIRLGIQKMLEVQQGYQSDLVVEAKNLPIGGY